MKWDVSSVDTFIQHQAYIDTAVIPFVQVLAGDQLRESVTKATWLVRVANALEEQLTGRMMLFPAFSYTGFEDDKPLIDNANTYFRVLRENHFQHIVCLTLDETWRDREERLDARLLIPTFEEDELDLSSTIVNQCAQQLVQHLIRFWKNSEKMN